MLKSPAMRAALLLLALGAFPFLFLAGPSTQPSSGMPVFRAESSLTLVDVIAEETNSDSHSPRLLTHLRREDLRVFDDGHEMPIVSFDVGLEQAVRPVTLWLIVQCNQGEPTGNHSLFIRGNTGFLKPALSHLAKNDAIGVAHWCDTGKFNLDMLPAAAPDAALSNIEDILSQKPVSGMNGPGELAMRSMIRLILANTQETQPRRLPIFLFLYGDQCATEAEEANRIAADLLKTSGMVYGINDGSTPFDPRLMRPPKGFASNAGQLFYLVHYYAAETGGEVYSTRDGQLFSSALDYILTQLHLRYTIGFRPARLDGKHHTLELELTDDARKKYPKVKLRYRREYIPTVSR